MVHLDVELAPINGSCFTSLSEGIPFTRQDYFELVGWMGWTLWEDKCGAIDSQLPYILQRLGIQPENWIDPVSYLQIFLMQWVRSLLLSYSDSGEGE